MFNLSESEILDWSEGKLTVLQLPPFKSLENMQKNKNYIHKKKNIKKVQYIHTSTVEIWVITHFVIIIAHHLVCQLNTKYRETKHPESLVSVWHSDRGVEQCDGHRQEWVPVVHLGGISLVGQLDSSNFVQVQKDKTKLNDSLKTILKILKSEEKVKLSEFFHAKPTSSSNRCTRNWPSTVPKHDCPSSLVPCWPALTLFRLLPGLSAVTSCTGFIMSWHGRSTMKDT